MRNRRTKASGEPKRRKNHEKAALERQPYQALK